MYIYRIPCVLLTYLLRTSSFRDPSRAIRQRLLAIQRYLVLRLLSAFDLLEDAHVRPWPIGTQRLGYVLEVTHRRDDAIERGVVASMASPSRTYLLTSRPPPERPEGQHSAPPALSLGR